MGNRTGVLIHGLHLEAKGWEEIMWGRPPHSLGRLPQGVSVALRKKAIMVLFCTGESERNGKSEAEVAKNFLLDRFFELAQFADFEGVDLESARNIMQRVSVVKGHAQNTAQEVRLAGKIFEEAGVDKIILVSSPFHISRCMRDAFIAFNEDDALRHFTHNLFATPSQTCFPGMTAEDVTIIEPPHKPDQTSSKLIVLVQRMLKMPKEKQEGFLAKLELLLAE